MGQVHETALKIIEEVENTDGLDILGMLNSSIRTLGNTILDADEEWEHFIEYVSDGNDPTQHTVYHASLVTGNFETFKEYTERYYPKKTVMDEEYLEEVLENIKRIEEFFKIMEENHG